MDLKRIADEFIGERPGNARRPDATVQPVHVFYGGADLFKANIHEKLGRVALSSIESYAPDLVTFAKALWLKGADSLPDLLESEEIERLLSEDPERAEAVYPGASHCLEIFSRTKSRLQRFPVEDYRIDFEDGYGFRSDDEEDSDAKRAGSELASAINSEDEACRRPAYGFRVKSLGPETRERSIRTLEMFLRSLAEKLQSPLSEDFAVAFPKVEGPDEISAACKMLETCERELGLGAGRLKVEVMVETPAVLGRLKEIAEAGGERLRGTHFGAYDYTSLLGISSDRQHLHHEACIHARNRILNDLSGSGLWLSDSVTTTMPVPLHKELPLKDWQARQNSKAVHAAWRLHFSNVIRSMSAGFYQSWDLHPAQLVARYAAVYSFYLESADSQMARLKAFIDKASKATLTGNAFDDAASAEGLLNFIRRGISCGALDAESTAAQAGISTEQLIGSTFSEIVAVTDQAGTPSG